MAAAKLHLSLNVRDLEKSVKFYSDLLGAQPHKIRPGYANFDIESPALKLALNAYQDDFGRGALNHLGILVDSPEKVTEAINRLDAAGLVESIEEDVVCCHAKQQKVWARDPDGNAWEVYTILDDMQNTEIPVNAQSERCCEPTCCT